MGKYYNLLKVFMCYWAVLMMFFQTVPYSLNVLFFSQNSKLFLLCIWRVRIVTLIHKIFDNSAQVVKNHKTFLPGKSKSAFIKLYYEYFRTFRSGPKIICNQFQSLSISRFFYIIIVFVELVNATRECHSVAWLRRRHVRRAWR